MNDKFAMTVGSLLTEPFQKCNILLHSGRAGLTNKIDRVTVMEAKDSPNFYTGGELVMTTLFCVKDDEVSQRNLIAALVQTKAAGLIIKMDRYFTALPDFFAAESEKYGFPILQIGSAINYRDLIYEIYQFKFFYNKYYHDLLELLIGSGSNVHILKELNMDFKKAVIWVANGENSDIYYKALSNHLIVKIDNHLVGIVRITGKTVRSDITHIIASGIGVGINSHLVVSQTFENANMIRQMVQTTLTGFAMLKALKQKNEILYIEDYEIETILLRAAVFLKDDCLDFAATYAKPLIDYDLSHNHSLVKSAEAFYLYSSIATAAEKLSIHPNTLRYHLNLIQTLVGIDTRIFEDNFKLYSALFYYRMLKS